MRRSILRSLASEVGLDGVDAAAADRVPVDPGLLRERVAAAPAELAYLARGLDKRLDPCLVLPSVRTVVAAYVAYAPETGTAPDFRPGEGEPDGERGWISRFAWSRDYHDVVGARVAALAAILRDRFGAATRDYVDTGPVLEKAWAAAAGLGFIGRHTLLVTPRHGSFVFLGVVLTDLEIEDDVPPAVVPDGCGSCRACRDACPTGALDRDRVLDVTRCLAHQTVTARELPPADLPLAGQLYGCDLCQDACPWNRRAAPGRPEFAPLPGLFRPRLDDVLALDDDGFRQRFGPTPIRRRGRERVQGIARMLQSPRPPRSLP